MLSKMVTQCTVPFLVNERIQFIYYIINTLSEENYSFTLRNSSN